MGPAWTLKVCIMLKLDLFDVRFAGAFKSAGDFKILCERAAASAEQCSILVVGLHLTLTLGHLAALLIIKNSSCESP